MAQQRTGRYAAVKAGKQRPRAFAVLLILQQLQVAQRRAVQPQRRRIQLRIERQVFGFTLFNCSITSAAPPRTAVHDTMLFSIRLLNLLLSHQFDCSRSLIKVTGICLFSASGRPAAAPPLTAAHSTTSREARS